MAECDRASRGLGAEKGEDVSGDMLVPFDLCKLEGSTHTGNSGCPASPRIGGAAGPGAEGHRHTAMRLPLPLSRVTWLNGAETVILYVGLLCVFLPHRFEHRLLARRTLSRGHRCEGSHVLRLGSAGGRWRCRCRGGNVGKVPEPRQVCSVRLPFQKTSRSLLEG